jgi:hypothetical protein
MDSLSATPTRPIPSWSRRPRPCSASTKTMATRKVRLVTACTHTYTYMHTHNAESTRWRMRAAGLLALEEEPSSSRMPARVVPRALLLSSFIYLYTLGATLSLSLSLSVWPQRAICSACWSSTPRPKLTLAKRCALSVAQSLSLCLCVCTQTDHDDHGAECDGVDAGGRSSGLSSEARFFFRSSLAHALLPTRAMLVYTGHNVLDSPA